MTGRRTCNFPHRPRPRQRPQASQSQALPQGGLLTTLTINRWWVPKIAVQLDRDATSIAYWLRYDPCFNAEAARWIYLTMLRSGPPFWRAIGQFHSPVTRRQDRYVESVASHMRRCFGDCIFAVH